METSLSIWLVLVPALAGLVGALGSQAIGAAYTLKTKKMELSFARKADAYRDFLAKAAKLAYDPKSESCYGDYLLALMSLRLVASKDVASVSLDVNKVAQELRRTSFFGDHSEQEQVRASWPEAMESLMVVMRDDLNDLSTIL